MAKTATITTTNYNDNALQQIGVQTDKLNNSQFIDFLRLSKPTEFIYNDENNREHKQNRIRKKIHEPMLLQAYYNEIIYLCDVSGYYFRDKTTNHNTRFGYNYMRITNVKYITITPTIIGYETVFHCEYDGSIIAYTFIIR